MLNFEKYQEIGKNIQEEEKRRYEMQAKIRDDELRKVGVNPNTQITNTPKYDHPSTLDNGLATTLYIIGMAVSLIFKDFWIAWIGLTIAYSKFITRHNND